MTGIIACDIDGTLTDQPFHIPEKVLDVLSQAAASGWELIFMTGRPFAWGVRPLLKVAFPYHLAVINGANLLEMPERTLVHEILIPKDCLKALDVLCKDHGTGYVAYGGYSVNDVCFFRPDTFSGEQKSYLEKRCSAFGETWIAVEDFNELPIKGFASVKCFGDQALCNAISFFMEKEMGLQAPVIRDPFQTSLYVVQATHASCNKGKILRLFIDLNGLKGPLIAAGDDYNDLSMLQMADKRIVMATAPEEILALADVIAQPASESGLAQALLEIMEKLRWKQ